ncbi:MAG TPA: DnaJ domain-containing protein [Nannocystis sp.]
MTDILAAVVSIAPTRRRRFLWCAWWTESPSRDPFRKPDASSGGARTREEALREAEAAAGRSLVEVEGLWARAWARVLMGQPAFPPGASGAPAGAAETRARRDPPAGSIWQVLGVDTGATVEQIRAAFRQRVLVTHPDHGGDPDAFRQLRAAYDEALERRARARKRPRRK